MISVDSLRPYLTIPMKRISDILRFVILSTGRAGSGSTAAAFNCLGIPCGHESIFNPFTAHLDFDEMTTGAVDLMGDSAWPAVAWIDEFPENLPLFHLVRHPLKYVNSLTQPPGYWAGSGGPYTALKRAVLPEIPQGPEELCSMIHWLDWNLMIERRVPKERRFRLEDQLPAMMAQVCCELGFDRTDEQISEALSEGREIRENKHRTGEALFQAEDLKDFPEYEEFAAKAKEYGYDLDEPLHLNLGG